MSARRGNIPGHPVFSSEIDEVFDWIERMGFMFPARSSRTTDAATLEKPFNPSSPPVIASPASRTQKYTKAELDKLEGRLRSIGQRKRPSTTAGPSSSRPPTSAQDASAD